MSTPIDATSDTRVPWTAPLAGLARFPILFTAFAFEQHIGGLSIGTYAASMSALMGATSLKSLNRKSWSQASWRHRAATVVGIGSIVVLPPAAARLIPLAYRHNNYVLQPVAVVAVIAGLFLYVALIRRPGFEPPCEPSQAEARRSAPVPVWTRSERATRLGPQECLVIRPRYRIAMFMVVFGFVAFIAFGVSVAELVGASWGWAMAWALICGLAARSVVRSGRLAVIADVDGMTVRNVQLTHRLAWTEIRRIVPPSRGGYLRIERVDDKRIEATAVAAGLLWQSTNRAGAVDALISLLGPAESIEIASADRC